MPPIRRRVALALAVWIGLTGCGDNTSDIQASAATVLEERVNAIKFNVASDNVAGAQDALAALTVEVSRLVDAGTLDEERAAVILEVASGLDGALARHRAAVDPTPTTTTSPSTTVASSEAKDPKDDKGPKEDKDDQENKGKND